MGALGRGMARSGTVEVLILSQQQRDCRAGILELAEGLAQVARSSLHITDIDMDMQLSLSHFHSLSTLNIHTVYIY